MAVSDPQLKAALNEARNVRKRFSFGKTRLLLGRLDLNDNCVLDQDFGINLFAELAAAAKEGSGIPTAWSYPVQRKILHLALIKQYPDLVVEEVGSLRALLSDREYWGAISWVSSGIETPKEEISEEAQTVVKRVIELLTPFETELAPQIDALGTYVDHPSVVKRLAEEEETKGTAAEKKGQPGGSSDSSVGHQPKTPENPGQ